MTKTFQSHGKVIGIDFNEVEKNKILSLISNQEIMFIESNEKDTFDQIIESDAYVIMIPWRQWTRLSKDNKGYYGKSIHIKRVEDSFLSGSDIFSECLVAISSKILEKDDELRKVIDDAKGLNNYVLDLKKEIALYRELYFRKAYQLDFLNEFFGTVTPLREVEEILKSGFFKIKEYFDIQSLCVLIPEENGSYKFYITDARNREFWIDYVLKRLKLCESSLNIITLGIDVSDSKTVDVLDVSPSRENFKVYLTGDTNHMGSDEFSVLEMAIEHLCLLIQRAMEYEKLSSFAYIDFLTGVGNRHYFDRIIRQEVKRHERLGSKFSMVMIDIDHFKEINDRFGHIAGDMVLKQLASIIKDNAREIDYVIRFGGEEFLVVLPHTDKNSGYVFAERLRQKIEEYNFQIDGERTIKVTVSMGVSEFDPKSGYHIKDAVKWADSALYKSKEGGRNKVSVV